MIELAVTATSEGMQSPLDDAYQTQTLMMLLHTVNLVVTMTVEGTPNLLDDVFQILTLKTSRIVVLVPTLTAIVENQITVDDVSPTPTLNLCIPTVLDVNELHALAQTQIVIVMTLSKIFDELTLESRQIGD